MAEAEEVIEEEELLDPDDLAFNQDLFNEDVVGEQVVLETSNVVSVSVTTTTATLEKPEEIVDLEDDGEGDEEPKWLKLDELMEGEQTLENDTEVTVAVLDGLNENGQDEEGAYNQYLTYFAQYLIGHPTALVTKTRKRPGKGAEKRYFGEAKSEDVMADKTLTGCWACGKLDHDSSDCVFKRCFVCSVQGHEMVECPNKTIWCNMCRGQGHSGENCPNQAYNASTETANELDAQFCRCLKCGEEGHLHCGEVPASSSTAQAKGFGKGGFGKGGGYNFGGPGIVGGAGWKGQPMQPGSLLLPGKGGSLLRPAWSGQQQPQVFRPGIWRPPVITPSWRPHQQQQYGMRPVNPLWHQHYQNQDQQSDIHQQPQQQQQQQPWRRNNGWGSNQQQHQQPWSHSSWSQPSAASSWNSNGWSDSSRQWQQNTPNNDADWDAEVEGPAGFNGGDEADDFDEEYEGDVDPSQVGGDNRGQKRRGGRKLKKPGNQQYNWPREGDAGNDQKRQRWW